MGRRRAYRLDRPANRKRLVGEDSQCPQGTRCARLGHRPGPAGAHVRRAMSAENSRQEALSTCRRHLVLALAREHEEWEGSVATLHLLNETPSPGKISVSIGKLTGPPPHLLEAMKSSSHAMLSATGPTRSFIFAPVSMIGRTWGIVTLQTSETHTLSPKDVEIAEKYATMLALTFEMEHSSTNGR